MMRGTGILCILGLVATWGLIGCSDDGEKIDDGGVSGEIKFALVVPVSGLDEDLGRGQKQGAELAAAEINAAGGVLGGKKIVFETVNEEDADLAAKLQALVDDPAVVGFVGPAFSSTAMSLVPLIKGKKAAIGTSCSSPALTDADDGGMLFRTMASDAGAGAIGAKYAKDVLKGTKASVIHRDDTYGKGLNETFAEAFKALDGTILAQVAFPEKEDYTDHDFSADVATAFKGGPDILYMATFGQDGVRLISAVKADQGYAAVKDKVNFVGSDGQSSADFAGGADPSVIGGRFFGTLPGPPPSDPNFKKFGDAYNAKFSRAAVGTAENAYDAVYLFAYAIEAANTTDPGEVAKKLPDVSKGGTAVNVAEWATGKEIAKTGDIDYQGASGVIEFDAAGDIVANYAIYTVESGALKVIQETYK